MFSELESYIIIDPKLPDSDKSFVSKPGPEINVSDTRDIIVKKITDMSGLSETALLSLYVYRQMDRIDWIPFIKAAIERNPVCFKDLDGKTTDEVYEILLSLENESIYDGKRLALPDEVWNFQRGDGIEKALLLADFIIHKDGDTRVSIGINDGDVIVENTGEKYRFNSKKSFVKSLTIRGSSYSVN